MSNLFDLLVAGLATGAIYALVAVGFTLLWQTSQTINFAQGEFVMLPAFLMLAAMHAGARRSGSRSSSASCSRCCCWASPSRCCWSIR
ncbi:branched-subunit amino acid ABC-type transport system permease component [Bradyrhizobium sp. LM2.9]